MKQLTVAKFQHMVWRNLIVRSRIEQVFDESKEISFPNGRLKILSYIYSSQIDSDTNRVVLEIRYEYSAPSNNYQDGLGLEIDDIWSTSERDRNRNFFAVLEEWKRSHPLWLEAKAHAAYLTRLNPQQPEPIYAGHGHLLQHYNRLQIALAGIITKGHPYQGWLCGTVYSLQQLIENFNRKQEFEQAMGFYTPEKFRTG